jgi:formyltetrahydrofolate deformylase
MNTNILRIDCVDKIGLIHTVTGVLLSHNVNIIENDEYVDRDSNRFFMRTEFNGEFDSGNLLDEIKYVLPENAEVHLTGKRKKNIVVLATKEHHCIGEILLKHMYNDINANIMAVISNNTILKPLADIMKIPFHFISHDNISRENHEQKIETVLSEYNPEYVVLAKYMRILTGSFTEKYKGKIINIHHSFLPAFIGANPYKQAYYRGVKIIGATAHFVTEDLDEGPIIVQDVIHVNHTYSIDALTKAGREVEKNVLSRALDLVFDDRVIVNGNKTIVFA